MDVKRLVRILGVLSGILLLSACGKWSWPASRIVPEFEHIDTLRILSLPSNAQSDEEVSLASLQGLINDPRPRLYVEATAGDVFWSQHALPGAKEEPLTVPATVSGACGVQPTTLVLVSVRLLCTVLRTFPGVVRGLVIDNPNLPATIDVATTLAGQDHAMVVTPEQASFFEGAPFHLKVLANLNTENWTSNIEAYTWEFDHLWAKADHRLLFSLDPTISLNLREYAAATDGFVFWLHPSENPDRALLEKILAAAVPDTPVLGWWTNEPAGVALASQYQHVTVATDFMDNLSVFGAFPPPTQLKQTAPAPLPKLAPRVYYSVQFSDGDNLQYMEHRLRQIWEDPNRATVPASYTVQPWATEMAPTILEYYYHTATTDNLFVTGPSGPGYFYPEDWPADTLDNLLHLGVGLLKTDDIPFVEVWNYGDANGPELADYATVLHPEALLLGMGGSAGGIAPLDGTLAITNVGFPTTVAQAVSLLQPLAGNATDPTGPNLAANVQPTLGSGAPSGTTVTGDQVQFPAAASTVSPSGGVAYDIPIAHSAASYILEADLSGSGEAVVDVWNGQQNEDLAYELSATPQPFTLDVNVPDSAGALQIALVPEGGAAAVVMQHLSVQVLQSPPLTTPRFVNLYIDAWDFTPSMVAQVEDALGLQFQLVRLDQLVSLWREEQSIAAGAS